MTDDPLALTRRSAIRGGAVTGATLMAAGPAAGQTPTPPASPPQPVPQPPAPVAGTATAQGTVFEDRQLAGRGPGIPGVMVSNGRDVVLTDDAGRWTLSARPGDSLFVIKPNGWITPFHGALPVFAYVHEPDGTPAALGLRYPGVPPTGKLPPSIDFPLRRHAEARQFDVLLFTDPQPESAAELDFVRDAVIAPAGRVDAAFGITCGDVMFDDLSQYGRSDALIRTIGLPWYHLPGNHDMNYESSDDRWSKETFKRTYGARHYAWQWGGTTFVALDNVEYLGDHRYRGRFGADQLGFLRGVVAHVPDEDLVVVCMHIPLRTAVGTAPATACVDWVEFLEVVSGRNCLSFSGHTHTNEHHYLTARPGAPAHHHQVLTAVSGSWWSGPFDARGIPIAIAGDGTPNGFHILSIDGSRAVRRLVAANEPVPAGMRVNLGGPYHREMVRDTRAFATLRSPIARSELGATSLMINLFDGGPRSEVRVMIGGATLPCERTLRRDPYVQELYERNRATKKSWVEAVPSSHLWQARLPADLPRGTWRVEIAARDDHGQVHEGVFILEVEA